MPLIVVLLVLLAVGAVVALVNQYGSPYIDGKFIKLINVVAVIGTIIWLLVVFNIWHYLTQIRVG